MSNGSGEGAVGSGVGGDGGGLGSDERQGPAVCSPGWRRELPEGVSVPGRCPRLDELGEQLDRAMERVDAAAARLFGRRYA